MRRQVVQERLPDGGGHRKVETATKGGRARRVAISATFAERLADCSLSAPTSATMASPRSPAPGPALGLVVRTGTSNPVLYRCNIARPNLKRPATNPDPTRRWFADGRPVPLESLWNASAFPAPGIPPTFTGRLRALPRSGTTISRARVGAATLRALDPHSASRSRLG